MSVNPSNGQLTAGAFLPTSATIPATGMYRPADNILAWATNSNERARLNADGNFGLGTSSPGYRLDVSGSGRFSAGLAVGGNLFSGQSALFIQNSGKLMTLTNTGATNGNKTLEINSAGSMEIRDHAGTSVILELTDGGALTVTGGSTAGRFVPSSATVPTNGMYLPAANTLGFATNSVERMRIDSTGNFMLGATSSSSKLYVTGSGVSAPIGDFVDTSSNNNSFQISATSSTIFGVNLKLIGNTSGQSAPSKFLRVLNSQLEIINHAYNSAILTLTDGGSLSVVGEVTAYSSDGRLKGNVQIIANALEKIEMIRGITFDWNDTAADLGFVPEDRHDVGVIAQEVEAVLPEAVRHAPFDRDMVDKTKSKSGENYLTVQYEKLTALLIEAVKELHTKVTYLENEIKNMQGRE